jgi:alpha-tubulin suppressor-like RCC1 family protein
MHTCAIVNGGAQCWGANFYGDLGNNSTTNASAPVQVTGLASGVTGIAAGGYHVCALANGHLQCWGDNTYGQLGNTTATSCNGGSNLCGLVPSPVTGL